MQTQIFFLQIILQVITFFLHSYPLRIITYEFEIRIEELSIDFILFVGFEIIEQILLYIVVSKPNKDYE